MKSAAVFAAKSSGKSEVQDPSSKKNVSKELTKEAVGYAFLGHLEQKQAAVQNGRRNNRCS